MQRYVAERLAQPFLVLLFLPAVYHRLGAILGHEAAKVALRLETVPRRERLE